MGFPSVLELQDTAAPLVEPPGQGPREFFRMGDGRAEQVSAPCLETIEHSCKFSGEYTQIVVACQKR